MSYRKREKATRGVWQGGKVWGGVLLVLTLATMVIGLAQGCGRNEATPVVERVLCQASALLPFVNNPPCALTCSMGEEVTCGECETRRTDGQSCSTDECGSYVCATGLSCVVESSNEVCRPTSGTGLGVLEPCDVNDDRCAHGLYCRDFDECYPDSEGLGARRAAGVHEDMGICDGVWGDYKCAQCIPGGGTTPGAECGSDGLCRVACADDADCPCEDDDSGRKCDDGLCYRCRSLGDACNDQVRCCDEDTTCGSMGTCCKTGDGDCASNADCCNNNGSLGSLICNPSTHQCQECKAVDTSCSSDWQCCSGYCKEGECNPNCGGQDGLPCTVSGVLGECKKGLWDCGGESVLTCEQPNSPTTETCNGLDDDCDGKIDEGTFGSCTYEYDENDPTCQDGFEADGNLECDNGVEVCVPDLKSVCVDCGLNGNGDNCGECGATPCAGPCSPGYTCTGDGSPTCQPISGCMMVDPPCWHPADASTCCGDCTP